MKNLGNLDLTHPTKKKPLAGDHTIEIVKIFPRTLDRD
jgi:hypothetical protein